MDYNTVKISHLAKFIIRYYLSNKDVGATNLELQKVLYYLQAYHLVYFDNPLFKEEPEAWVRGPVYRKIYDKYKEYGAEPIEIETDSKEDAYEEALNQLDLKKQQLVYIRAALDFFSNMSYGQLITRSHNEKPWNEARKGLGPLDYSNGVITHESMKNYYEVKAAEVKTEKANNN